MAGPCDQDHNHGGYPSKNLDWILTNTVLFVERNDIYRRRQNNGMVHVFSNNDRSRQLWSFSPFLTWPDRFLIDSPAGIFSIFTTLIWNGTNMERGGRGTNKKMECYSISDMSNKRLYAQDTAIRWNILTKWWRWGYLMFGNFIEGVFYL